MFLQYPYQYSYYSSLVLKITQTFNKIKNLENINKVRKISVLQQKWYMTGKKWYNSKYLTASLSSTDLHEKDSAFPAILPKLTIL